MLVIMKVELVVDLLVRLLARLYPTITFRAEQDKELADEASALASRINPRIDLSGKPTVEIVIGQTRIRRCAPQRIFVGSNGWNATISTRSSQACGDSDNPFGAGGCGMYGSDLLILLRIFARSTT